MKLTHSVIYITLALLAFAAIVRPQEQDNPGKAALDKICLDCHGMDMISGTGMTKAGWQQTVDDMVRKGAAGSDDELSAIVEYLTETYPPAKINVNTESAGDLQIDLDITGSEAHAIVRYREANGKFKSFDDLKKVPNVDGSKLDAKKDRVVF